MLQQCVYLMSIHHASTSCPITHPHVFSLRPPCFLHVPWRHIFNLCYTCAHHVYTMRNPCPLTSSPNPNSISRLFPILLDRSSLCHMTSRSCAHLLSLFRCRLIIIILNPNPKVCPHFRLITLQRSWYRCWDFFFITLWSAVTCVLFVYDQSVPHIVVKASLCFPYYFCYKIRKCGQTWVR